MLYGESVTPPFGKPPELAADEKKAHIAHFLGELPASMATTSQNRNARAVSAPVGCVTLTSRTWFASQAKDGCRFGITSSVWTGCVCRRSGDKQSPELRCQGTLSTDALMALLQECCKAQGLLARGQSTCPLAVAVLGGWIRFEQRRGVDASRSRLAISIPLLVLLLAVLALEQWMSIQLPGIPQARPAASARPWRHAAGAIGRWACRAVLAVA